MQNLQQNNKLVNLKKSENVSKNMPAHFKMNSSNPIKTITNIVTNSKLDKIQIIKKDSTLEKYNIEKVVSAVKKSAQRMLIEFSQNEIPIDFYSP